MMFIYLILLNIFVRLTLPPIPAVHPYSIDFCGIGRCVCNMYRRGATKTLFDNPSYN